MTTPDFIVVGHVVRDLSPQGSRLGGTATFAAVQAQRLGFRVGIVTRVGPEVALEQALPEIEVAGRPAEETTAFENVYDGAGRRQRVPGRAPPISAEDIPAAWREAPIALIGPVCGEAPAEFGSLFPNSLVGVGAQGWLRRLDQERTVRPQVWDGDPFWRGCQVLFVSDEDLRGNVDQLERWTGEVPVVVLTRDRRGARVHEDGRWREIEAFPADDADPTGAGDILAASFLVRYHETEDAGEAARFASAASACSIEAEGIEGVAGRAEIEARMAAHPEVVLR